ncbi:hypothetical protein [Duganella vulcania]|uniref:Uncharacterized protein n=1 Tax=Duganella vulcania TaxID=2692166 RepID=A0A845GVX8_9BURK|nr:hypothetical protein [Duganella vulcania]MYM97482.1 hypothetical protein [Duganella vulcania]
MDAKNNYNDNVFINCPFDEDHKELQNAMVFAIYDCGFVPRCALEENDAGDVRFDKIRRLIEISRYGIHDISRTELDRVNGLPRFNMPFELGLFLGARRYGDEEQKKKNLLILDREEYRYQKFLSDIAGQDIRSHAGNSALLIGHVRNWLSSASRRTTIPGGKEITARYALFSADLPAMCQQFRISPDEITFNDYSLFVSEWLKKTNAAS